jgi:hypothetical protein
MKQADDFYTNHTNKWILVVGLLGVLLALGATSIATGTWILVGVSILSVAMWLASYMGGMAHAREGVSDECWQCVMSKGKSAGISADDEFVNLLGSELLGHLGLPGKRLVNSILGSISNIIGAGIDTNPHDDWTKPLLGSWGYVI